MAFSPDYPLAPPSEVDHSMNLSMLYYSFFVVATAGVLLAIYHCLIVNWCTRSTWGRSEDPLSGAVSVRSFECRKVVQLESAIFTYWKGGDGGGVAECVVCLSAYEEGEDVRRLLRCNHCFHATCIDMWLYSHYDCPLCREPVGDIKGIVIQENLRSGLSDPINMSETRQPVLDPNDSMQHKHKYLPYFSNASPDISFVLISSSMNA